MPGKPRSQTAGPIAKSSRCGALACKVSAVKRRHALMRVSAVVPLSEFYAGILDD